MHQAGGGTISFTYYVDSDSDTFGDENDSGTEFTEDTPPSGYSINNDDCDDDNANIHPGADETENDGVDSNCDGFDNT